ncbi:putative aspergillopepsin A-like aspartic endopeptidase [Lachnellula hyalina]|uniref:Putative aspergillopepsin A-like aspartic endopeptidase n=1 Tax=Lachnellula hyalina TaxID=1316788 RepID=A0A8H8R1Z7_9HELO|nr:putative aspergillopepsin A-like aspartic endopeptidase [Lachnellula hyalina]TVY26596.1 putative aspergillopepsin A-like aspartic endopeptidase [Lachnellula hyalina]
MHSLLQTLFLLTIVTLALAAPAPERHAPIQKRSFKVERVPNPNFKRTPGAGTRAMIKAHRKYLIPLPPGLADAMSQAQGAGATADTADALTNSLAGLTGGSAGTGAKKGKAKGSKSASSAVATPTGAASTASSTAAASNGTAGSGKVTATPETGDTEFLSPVTIGGQTMNMDFDSGSSDLWVFNTQLSTASQAGHTVFDSTKSSTFKLQQGASFTISYGDGSGAAGNVGTDTVNIGGASVTGQAIEMATAVSSSFVQDTQSNGLVGLAFSKLNTVKPTQAKTFFDNAMATLAQPVFTADLRKAAVGAYEFGNIDSTKFNGSLSWAAVNTTQGFWQFSSQKFQVGTGTAMSVAGGQAIADTGTTLMLVNAAVVNAYYSQVTGAVNNQTVGGVTFPCSATLPDLMVDIGGNYMAQIRGDDINFAQVDAGSATCFGGVQAIDSSLQIYGDIMFKSQFVAFNGGNNSIGMAPHQS